MESYYHSGNAFPTYIQHQHWLEDPHYHMVLSPNYLYFTTCCSCSTFRLTCPICYNCSLLISIVCSIKLLLPKLRPLLFVWDLFLNLLLVLSAGMTTVNSLSWCIGSHNMLQGATAGLLISKLFATCCGILFQVFRLGYLCLRHVCLGFASGAVVCIRLFWPSKAPSLDFFGILRPISRTRGL